VQECLTNIEKHAGATETSVLVHGNNNGELLICVSDNGKGFSPPDRDSCRELRAGGHYGLWSIYERAASISGTLTFDSNTGEGTMVTLQIPITKSR
jgi:signal transduction histidine kinase